MRSMVKSDEQILEGGRAVKKENTVLSVLCIVLVIVCLVLASALKTAKHQCTRGTNKIK